jgi:hypothetical protein
MVVVFLAFWSLQGHGFTWCLGGKGLELVSSSGTAMNSRPEQVERCTYC